MIKKNKKICFVLTAEFAVTAFLLEHLKALSDIYDITVIVNTKNSDFLAQQGLKARVVSMAITRDVSLISDAICLIKLVRIFYQHKFSAVHSVTPKAGLLAMLAAWISRVPLRVHTFTGQVWVTRSGYKRFFLKQFDCLIAFLTTHNIVDSPSQSQFLLDEKVMNAEKTLVFAKGSISGVDIEKFKPNLQARETIRQQLNIEPDAILFLFLGRLTRDKGVLDLAQAFSCLQSDKAYLLFVGPDEQSLQDEILKITAVKNLFVRFVGYTNKPQDYMASADVLCLPSYREGFGSVIIEAAAVGIPAIASRIYGITDAVVDGETGLLHDVHDVRAIQACLENIIQNEPLRLKLAAQAKSRAIKDFSSHLITEEWVSFYSESLQ